MTVKCQRPRLGPSWSFAVVSAVFACRKMLAEMSFTNMNIAINNSVPPTIQISRRYYIHPQVNVQTKHV